MSVQVKDRTVLVHPKILLAETIMVKMLKENSNQLEVGQLKFN